MGVFVKICGLGHPGDIDAVAAMEPDAMGFIFWSRSPRYVKPEEVAAWAADVPRTIRKVGVFVDESAQTVREIAETAGLDVLQLHGDEDPGYVASLTGPVWKAIHLDRFDTDRASAYPVDAFLVDSYSSKAPGGTGRTVDWDRARAFIDAEPTPVLLAGGLRPENVTEAIRRTRPWGVDVSSGVEAEPGRKDLNRVKAFIEQCRNW